MKNFQIVVLVIFMVLAVFGVLVFSGAIKIGEKAKDSGSLGTVVLWGTIRSNSIDRILQLFNEANRTFTVKYLYKDPATFDQDLLEALASGTGPDLFFLPENLAYGYSNKIYTVPYESYPLATFKNTFASAGEVFTTDSGILAFPIAIDPLMMYYNRSILDAHGIVYPPAYWDEFTALVPTVSNINQERQILKSVAGLGQFSNVVHAKDVLAMLFMQSGNDIVDQKEGNFFSTLDLNRGSELSEVLSFYTDFANPASSSYTWNRSLPNSQDFFSAENSAFYFGFASELGTLVNKNPNQNLAVAPVPQFRGANFKATSSRVLGIAVSSFSKNFNTALTAASTMTSGSFATSFAQASGLVPARRDLLALKPTDSFLPIFYSSALYARSWLDPSPTDTNNVFRNMVDGVLSNSSSARDAVTSAGSRIDLLFR